MIPVTSFDALILAAGKGTRMPSPRPKTLQTLLGETMLGLVRATALSLPEIGRVWTVVGHGAAEVRADLARQAEEFAEGEPLWIEQTEQRGTGHALMTAMPFLEGAARVLVLNGDTPLLEAGVLRAFVQRAADCDVAFLTLTLEDAGAYGRVVRKDGKVTAVVEAKDYVPAVHGENPREINAGVYLVSLDAAQRLLPRLTTANCSGEYYITDLIGLAAQDGLAVAGVRVEDLCGAPDTAGASAIPALEHALEQAPDHALSLLGVNNPVELAAAEALLQKRRVAALLKSGVIVHAPEGVRVSPFAEIAPGAELFGPCEIYGRSSVGAGAVIESHCVLKSAKVAEGARIHSFSHLDHATVGERCIVGPYARLRPGAEMEEASHVGNFVEMKKARLGKGSKANHLTYLGDADIGPGVNVGAGTITCNYDGKNKHRTVIGAGSFIGSNTALVAPVTLGENTLVGAGSVITKDVPEGQLAVARAKQANLVRKK